MENLATDGRRLRSEREVYDRAPLSESSGELLVWDEVLFSRVVRGREYFVLQRVLESIRPRKILDVGSGAGWLTVHLAGTGLLAVGVDVSRRLLNVARSLGAGAAEFVQADGSCLPIANGRIDMVVSVAALHHLPVEIALREWKRVLTPGGTLVLFEPNSQNPLGTIGR